MMFGQNLRPFIYNGCRSLSARASYRKYVYIFSIFMIQPNLFLKSLCRLLRIDYVKTKNFPAA